MEVSGTMKPILTGGATAHLPMLQFDLILSFPEERIIMLKSITIPRSRASHRIPLLRIFSVLLILSLLLIPGATFAALAAAPRSTINIQILDISDWHGQLDPQSI